MFKKLSEKFKYSYEFRRKNLPVGLFVLAVVSPTWMHNDWPIYHFFLIFTELFNKNNLKPVNFHRNCHLGHLVLEVWWAKFHCGSLCRSTCPRPPPHDFSCNYFPADKQKLSQSNGLQPLERISSFLASYYSPCSPKSSKTPAPRENRLK